MISKFNCSIHTWTYTIHVRVRAVCICVCVCVCVCTALLHVIRVFYHFNWFSFWTFICNLSSKTYSAIYMYIVGVCVGVYGVNLYTIRKYYILPSSVSVCLCYVFMQIYSVYFALSYSCISADTYVYIYICTCVHVCRLSLSMRVSYVLMNVI